MDAAGLSALDAPHAPSSGGVRSDFRGTTVRVAACSVVVLPRVAVHLTVSPHKTWFSTGVFQLDSLNSRKQIDSGHFTPTEGHFAATAD